MNITLKELRTIVRREVSKVLKENAAGPTPQNLRSQLEEALRSFKENNNRITNVYSIVDGVLNNKVYEFAREFGLEIKKPYQTDDPTVFFSEGERGDGYESAGTVFLEAESGYGGGVDVGEWSLDEDSGEYTFELNGLPANFWPYVPYGEDGIAPPDEDE